MTMWGNSAPSLSASLLMLLFHVSSVAKLSAARILFKRCVLCAFQLNLYRHSWSNMDNFPRYLSVQKWQYCDNTSDKKSNNIYPSFLLSHYPWHSCMWNVIRTSSKVATQWFSFLREEHKDYWVQLCGNRYWRRRFVANGTNWQIIGFRDNNGR